MLRRVGVCGTIEWTEALKTRARRVGMAVSEFVRWAVREAQVGPWEPGEGVVARDRGRSMFTLSFTADEAWVGVLDCQKKVVFLA